MYDLVERVDAWRRGGTPAVVLRTVRLTGFGARTDGEAMAIAAGGERAGSLLNGAPVEELIGKVQPLLENPGSSSQTVRLTIGDRQAIAAGLACGGVAEVLLQPLRLLPEAAWAAFRSGRSVALVTQLDGASALMLDSAGQTAGSFGSAGLDQVALTAARDALARARTSTQVIEHEGVALFVEAFFPQVHVVVVGRATLADALAAQGELLGWQTDIVDGLEDSTRAVARLRASDAVVLLTHDKSIDAHILAEALRAGTGYVGALGSRANQTGRRDPLREIGLGEDEVARLKGPVGLDIGAASPAETAVAICAEIIATKAGRGAQPLTGSGVSIHA